MVINGIIYIHTWDLYEIYRVKFYMGYAKIYGIYGFFGVGGWFFSELSHQLHDSFSGDLHVPTSVSAKMLLRPPILEAVACHRNHLVTHGDSHGGSCCTYPHPEALLVPAIALLLQVSVDCALSNGDSLPNSL